MLCAWEVSRDEISWLLGGFSNMHPDVLTGYLGYHSWDVTLGQVAGSDFYMVNIVPAQWYNAIADKQEAFVRAGTGCSLGFRFHKSVVFHPLFPDLQACSECACGDLAWRRSMHCVLHSSFCAQYVLCDSTSRRDFYHTLLKSSQQKRGAACRSNECNRAGLRPLHH